MDLHGIGVLGQQAVASAALIFGIEELDPKQNPPLSNCTLEPRSVSRRKATTKCIPHRHGALSDAPTKPIGQWAVGTAHGLGLTAPDKRQLA
jgi:hypothetical protein